MSDLAIKVENLSKVYKLYDNPVDRLKETLNPFRKKYHRDFYALRDLNFEIERGETVGIIGKNGSGKSTLLKIIAGVLTPTAGAALVSGKVSALLELGTGFNSEYTGIENIYFSGTIMGYTKEQMDEKVDDILSFADIGDFVHQPVKVYSSGMYMRLAFAVATNIDPEILIIDEALSVGDAKFQSKSFARMEAFKKKGNTIIFVSHDLSSINYLCNRAIYIDCGKMVQEGETKLVTDLYFKNLFSDEPASGRAGGDNISGESREKDGAPAALNVSSDINNIDNREQPHASTQHGMQQEEQNHPRNLPITELQETSRKMLSAEKRNMKKSVLKRFNLNDMGSSEWGNKKAEFIDFGILDRQGEKTTLLHSGQAYSLFSKLLFYEEPGNLSLGIRIRTRRGMDVFVINSLKQAVKMPSLRRGDTLENNIAISMCLAPGDYFLGFGAVNYPASQATIYDSWIDAVHFKVVGDCLLDVESVVNLSPDWQIKIIP